MSETKTEGKMKKVSAKSLIGKRVEFYTWRDSHRGVLGGYRSGVVNDAKGRNISIDSNWYYLPNLHALATLETQTAPHGAEGER